MLLKDKVAVVTGAKQGIGLGIALALAKEGAKVVACDLDAGGAAAAVREIEKSGGRAVAAAGDVSQKETAEAIVDAAVKEFGRLDILVNNAGIYPFKSFADMTEADWDKVLAVNLKSVFLCSQAAAKVMGEGARIVNISSIASVVGFEGLTHYCASKGAINSFIRALALELAPKKINVNAVAPGAIITPGAGGSSTEQTDQLVAAIPLKRQGVPADIANAVVFLASDMAGYITGQTIIVDGGWTLR